MNVLSVPIITATVMSDYLKYLTPSRKVMSLERDILFSVLVNGYNSTMNVS